ncbi:LD-carboxypeptidase [Planctomycetota bacterium]|nr:LD-carboxypeptidase [Planctomycetota bacterium]
MGRWMLCVMLLCAVSVLGVNGAAMGHDEAEGKKMDEREWIKPKALEKGDTILFVAPASPMNKVRMERAKGRLEAMGFKTKQASDIWRTNGYLAGSDERRAQELMNAFTDPEVDAIFPGTGGYGTTRMLDKLDYEVIRQNPKMLIGFSDITGLHLAIGRHSRLITFHTPNTMYGLGSEGNLSDFSAKYFFRAIMAEQYKKGKAGYVIKLPEKRPEGMPAMRTIHGGKAKGRLVGGNLSLVAATMGTPYEIETKGNILYVEDVGEKTYRLDRMFSTMKLAGRLDELNGVILCHFTRAGGDEGDQTLDEVLDHYFKDLGIPVVAHFSTGHHKYNASLPNGAMAELDADVQTITILENPVELE